MSQHEIVVSVRNISKVYRLYNKPFDRVKEALSFSKKVYHKKFNALGNVSLELRRGEALGIIGRNGNGKSTLLKIIAEILTPTSGNIKTSGKISAILELTSNLKAEITGRQNIVYNLKIQGFISKEEIAIKTKEIEEFAEIGEFIDQPVKVYSSGMKSRLGFGIATSVEPDILILDEVLAVGDFNFQQKCLAKINGMRDNISMIFVSHSMNSVRLFCDRVIVLEKGNLAFNGDPDDAIKYYLEQEEKLKKELKKKEIDDTPFYWKLIPPTNRISNIYHYWLVNNKKQLKSKTGDDLAIIVKFNLNYIPKNLIVGFSIWTEEGNFITAIATDMDKLKLEDEDNSYSIRLNFKNILNPTSYITAIAIHDGMEYLYRGLNDSLQVTNNEYRYFGMVTLEHDWSINGK